MKSENNGKIAIALVAMFVVALSIVGFTYAYFTAQVQGNTADKSVEVTAGRLEIVYANGNEILAQNIVPGWVSDGKHFYDPQYSISDDDGDGTYEIVAVTTTDHPKKSDNTDPSAADGIATPVTFTVSNSDNNTADNSYIIRLTNITNGLAEADQTNFYITLYNDATVVWSGNLAATGETQVIVPAARTIASDGVTQNYSINLTYKNLDSEQLSKGVGVKATVEVIGVAKNDADQIVDADGDVVTFPAANTTVPTP